jgi:hypothetical protein
MVRGHSPRAEEWRDPEPVAEGEPDIDADPSGTLVGGRRSAWTPMRSWPAASWPAGWTGGLPEHRAALVEAARDHRAPDAVVAELERLPAATPTSGSATSSAPRVPDRDPTGRRAQCAGVSRRPRPRRSPPRRGGGTARAGEAFTILRMSARVDEVVDVGTDAPRSLQHRRCPRRGALRAGQPVDQRDQRLHLRRVNVSASRRTDAPARSAPARSRRVSGSTRPTMPSARPTSDRAEAVPDGVESRRPPWRACARPARCLVGPGLGAGDAVDWPGRPSSGCGRRRRWPGSAPGLGAGRRPLDGLVRLGAGVPDQVDGRVRPARASSPGG